MLTPAFVPPMQVEGFWHNSIRPMITREELAPLRDYVERTWIGRVASISPLLASYGIGSGVPPTPGQAGKKPMYPIKIWNQYRATIEERPRHNNYTESNNSKLQKLIKRNPSV